MNMYLGSVLQRQSEPVAAEPDLSVATLVMSLIQKEGLKHCVCLPVSVEELDLSKWGLIAPFTTFGNPCWKIRS